MQVLGVEEPLMCKAFLPTLKGLAQKWFLALPSRSIRCFNDLADRFLTHYAVNIKPQRNLTHLSGISQDEGEALKTYLTRWQKEVQTIEGLDEQVAITFFMESLRAGKLFIDLHNDRPKTYVEAMQRASRQADTEEAKASGKEETGDQSRKQGKLCLELQEKPEECLTKSRQPGTPPETPRSRNHSPGSGEILSYPQEVVGESPSSPHLKGWGEGLQRYPPLHGRRAPVFFDEASLGEPVRSSEESAVREDQRYPSSSSS
nr:uncharacterized protein LOC109150821 [Ipomoea trifida]